MHISLHFMSLVKTWYQVLWVSLDGWMIRDIIRTNGFRELRLAPEQYCLFDISSYLVSWVCLIFWLKMLNNNSGKLKTNKKKKHANYVWVRIEISLSAKMGKCLALIEVIEEKWVLGLAFNEAARKKWPVSISLWIHAPIYTVVTGLRTDPGGDTMSRFSYQLII